MHITFWGGTCLKFNIYPNSLSVETFQSFGAFSPRFETPVLRLTSGLTSWKTSDLTSDPSDLGVKKVTFGKEGKGLPSPFQGYEKILRPSKGGVVKDCSTRKAWKIFPPNGKAVQIMDSKMSSRSGGLCCVSSQEGLRGWDVQSTLLRRVTFKAVVNHHGYIN